MSEQIDKAKADLRRRKLVIGGTDSEQIMLLIESHDALISDRERLKTEHKIEIDHKNGLLNFIQGEYNKKKAELLTANKRIVELEKEVKELTETIFTNLGG